MGIIAAAALFLVSALVSLATSWLLVSRLERLGERLGMSEVVLGMLAALAADAPEITSAISAISQHQQEVGAGVVLGSNVFNLAALLDSVPSLRGPSASTVESSSSAAPSQCGLRLRVLSLSWV